MNETWKTVPRTLYKTDFGKYVATDEKISCREFGKKFPGWKGHLRTVCDPEEAVFYSPTGDGLTHFAVVVPWDEIELDDRRPERYMPDDTPPNSL